MDVLLRCVQGTSDKFYRVRVIGAEVVINYGRWGSLGRQYETPHLTPQSARTEAREIIEAKKKKGYVEWSVAVAQNSKSATAFKPETKQKSATLLTPVANERSFEL